jgi:serine/threonine-protein kinase
MEFIEGKNLNEIIKSLKQPIDEQTTINWAKQLCRVLFYLHTLNPPRIFRDLKPANIILQPNGVIKLIDFGTMKNYDESRAEDTVNLGTKGYAAPEQFGGRGQTDARTDIYGLGMTLYHLITGINPSLPPFELKPIRYYRKDISNGLEKIVMKCIEVERENRYQSAIEMLSDLEKL